MSDSQERIKQFKHDLIEERLALCSQKAQDRYRKLFPDGPSDDQYDDALALVDRTVRSDALRAEEE